LCTLQNITNFDGAKLQPLQEVTARRDLKWYSTLSEITIHILSRGTCKPN
jgi:hypothetical protein